VLLFGSRQLFRGPARYRSAQQLGHFFREGISPTPDKKKVPRRGEGEGTHAGRDRVWRERSLRSAVLAGDERAWQTWYDQSFARCTPTCAGAAPACAISPTSGAGNLADGVRPRPQLRPEMRQLRRLAARHRGHFLRKPSACPPRTRATVPLNGALSRRGQRGRADAERVAQALASLSDRTKRSCGEIPGQQSVAESPPTGTKTPKAVESLLSRARAAFREAYQLLE